MKIQQRLRRIRAEALEATQNTFAIALDLSGSLIKELVGIKQPFSSLFDTAEKILDSGLQKLEKFGNKKSQRPIRQPKSRNNPNSLDEKTLEIVKRYEERMDEVLFRERLDELKQLKALEERELSKELAQELGEPDRS